MTPIISPWYVWLFQIAEVFNCLLVGATIISGIFFLAGVIGVMVVRASKDETAHRVTHKDAEGRYYEEYITWEAAYLPIWKRMRKTAGIILFLVLPLAIATPTRNTLIGMVVAENITYERVDKIVQAGKSLKEEMKKDMIDIIKELQHDR